MKKFIFTSFFYCSMIFSQEKISFFEAITRNETNLVEYMLRNRAAINVTNVDGMTPLHLVSDLNIANSLILNGANIDARNNRGSTPLHWAVSRNKEAIVQLLLEYGANPNISDDKGNTPLHWAAKYGYDAIILHLLRKGAAVNSINKNGDTPLLAALGEGNQRSSRFLTLAGAKEISNQAYLAPTSFLSPITSPDLVAALSIEPMDPLIREIFTENYINAARLIASGVALNAQDVNGNTALHWAFTKRNRYISRMLLERGADINAFNNNGQSPADLFNILGDPDFEKFIKDIAGSKIQIRKENVENIVPK